ncbi:hypothetical protein NDA13_003219 [Ustilago tritici]|nr:hypothetical protein NDA13_003219 [Ustilago tritici]
MPSLWPFSQASSSRAVVESHNANQAAPLSSPTSTPAPIPPLIICEGFLSAAQSVVWGNEFRTYLGVGHQQLLDHAPSPLTSASTSGKRKRRSELGSSRPVVFAPIGPVSSLHDRACELFYALRGGTVDYGASHAKEHGHGCYGRHYPQPLCPGWGPDLPAHFLGHSLGGPTILKLQQLLRQGFFNHALGIKRDADEGENEWRAGDLILSVTSVSCPFRGTPLVYSLGSEPVLYPKVRMFSVGDIVSKLIRIAAYLDLPGFDAHADAWHFSGKRRKAAKRAQLTRGIAAQNPSKQQDLEEGVRSEKAEEEQIAGVTEFLTPHGEPQYHRPGTYWSLSPLTLTARLIGHFDYSRLQPLPSFLTSTGTDAKAGSEEGFLKRVPAGWWQNDGVVPLASQFHPLDCDQGRCRHFKGMPATLPHGKRRRRPQSTSEIKLPSPPQPLTPASETATLVDIESGPLLSPKKEDGGGLSLPATATRSANSNNSMLGSAKSAARIVCFTSLRAMNIHDPPLVTPSEEELNFLFPTAIATATTLSAHPEEEEKQSEREVESKLLEPQPNK